MPFQPWGGVEPVAGSEDYGYCHHVSILFPTWHRPYVAMFEVRAEGCYSPPDDPPEY